MKKPDYYTQICFTQRRTGNTTWLIEALVRRPHALFVCSNGAVELFTGMFYRALAKRPILNILTHLNLRGVPLFVGIDSIALLEKSSRPVIYDGGAMNAIMVEQGASTK